MLNLFGSEIRVLPFDGVFGTSWYASVTDTKTRANKEGAIRRFKLHAWLDGILLAFG